MIIYILNGFVTALISYGVYTFFDEDGIESTWSRKKKQTCMFFILLVWMSLYALRGITGSDAVVYRNGYKKIAENGLSLSYLFENYRDKLYQVLTYSVSNLSGGSWIAMCAVTGFFIYYPILKIIKEKSEDIQLSLLVFLFSLDGYFGYNGVRQMLAVSLSMYAYYFFLKERKYAKYVIAILIATGLHTSMLLVIPFHLVSLKKFKSFSSQIVVWAIIISCFVFGSVWGLFSELFGSNDIVAKYANALTEEQGSGIIRVFVYFSPFVLSIFKYNSLSQYYEDADSEIFMSFFAAIFMVYSMFSVSFSQTTYYFSFANTLLLPKVLSTVDPKNYRIFRLLIIFLYFVYMVFLLNNGDMGLNPYVPVWRSESY